MDPSAIKVAARFAATMEASKAAQLEKAAQRIPAIRGALVSDYSQPRAGAFDVTMDVVLHVAVATDAGPVKFKGSIPGISGALTRALKGVGASKVSVSPPSMVRGIRGTQYESDVMTATFEVTDAPL